MEIFLEFELKNMELPKDYAPAFVSYLKHTLSDYNANLFNEIYNNQNNREKDFCFCVRLDKPQFDVEQIKVSSNLVQLNMSILNPMEGIDFYNAFLNQKNKEYPFPNGNKITLKKLSLKNHHTISSNQILIKMCSPLLVRKHENGINTYLAFNDVDFNRCFQLSVKKMFDNLSLDVLNEHIEIFPIKAFKTVVNTFGNKISGNVGIYRLSGDVHTLNLLYQLGIGSRRSQGFGMFEIISEVK